MNRAARTLQMLGSSTQLSFSDRCLGDEGVRDLCGELALKEDLLTLDLRGCNVHAPGAAAIAELLKRGAKRLSSLSLEWNSIGTNEIGAQPAAPAPPPRHSSRNVNRVSAA